jgi:MFS transporter, ACS family, hexuronate transporter
VAGWRREMHVESPGRSGQGGFVTRQSGPGRPWAIAVVATLAMSVSYLDRQTLAAIAPTVRAELALSHEAFGWLTSAFAASYLAFSPLAGIAADRIGARKMLAGSVLVWSAVAAAHGLATAFVSMLVLRLLLGVAESPTFPSATQTIRRALPPERRSLGMGMLFTGSSFGAMLAAPLAVGITARFGFRFAFAGTALVGLLWLPAWWFFTRDLAGPERTSEPAEGDRPAQELTFGQIAVHPAVLRQMVLVATSAPAILVVLQWFPQYLVETSGVAKESIGRYLWLPPLLFDLAAVGFGAAASKLDARPGGAPHRGLVLAAALSCALLAFVPLGTGPWSRVIFASVAMGGGAGMYVLGTADMLRRLPVAAVATATGLSAAVQSLAQIVASPIIGAALDKDHAWGKVLISLGVLALPGGLVWMLWPAPPATTEAKLASLTEEGVDPTP